MSTIIIAFILILIAIFLILIGSKIIFQLSLDRSGKKMIDQARESKAGQPKTCPVCSIKLFKGEQVNSSVFPSANRIERIMHIKGCQYCLNPSSKRERSCPVCRKSLAIDSYLIAKMYDKPGRSHVHVLGCPNCRKR